MKQLSLLDSEMPRHCQPLHAPPAARTLAKRDGPESSHVAAREIVESGGQERQVRKIIELLRLRPASAKELANVAGEGGNFRARISDARKLGHVIEVRKTVCAATGGTVNLYFLTRDAEANE